MKNQIRNLLLLITMLGSANFAGAKEIDQTHLAESDAHPIFIRVHPFSLGFGVEYGVHDKLNVGVSGSFYNYHQDTNEKAQTGSIGVNTTWFSTSNISDSGYLKGILEYSDSSSKIKNKDNDEKRKVRETSISGSALVGYQWVYDSGIMLNTGIGMQVVKNTHNSDKKVKGSGVLPAGELAVGFRF